MALPLFLDTTNKRFVASKSSSLEAIIPTLLQGEQLPIELHFLKVGDAGYEDIDMTGKRVVVALGRVNDKPTDGYWIAEYAGESVQVPNGSTPAAVASALNGLSTIAAAGGVAVMGTPGAYRFVFLTPGARSELKIDAGFLAPASTAYVTRETIGSAAVRESGMIKLSRNPAAYQDTWLSNRYTKPEIVVTRLRAGAASVTEKQLIAFSQPAASGTFQLTLGYGHTEALPFNAPDAAVKTALQFSYPALGNITVLAATPDVAPYGGYIVTWVAAGPQTLLSGSSALVAPVSSETPMLTGTLDLGTTGIDALIGSAEGATCVLEVQYDGQSIQRTSITIRNELIETALPASTPGVRYASDLDVSALEAQVNALRYSVEALTGGVDLSEFAEDVAAINTSIETINQQIATHATAGSVTAAQQSIATLQTQLAALQQTVAALPSGGGNVDLSAVTQALSDLDSRIDTLEAAQATVTQLGNSLATVEQSLAALETAVAAKATDADLTVAEQAISTAQTAIATLQGDVQQLDAQIGNVNLTEVASAITGLNDQLVALGNTVSDKAWAVDMTAAQQAIADLETALAGKANAADLAAKANAADLATKANQGDMTAAQAAITNLQTAVAQKADSSALAAKANQSDLTALQTQVNNLAASAGALSSGRIFWIATTGNNSTGAVGDLSKPFANIVGLAASLLDGDTICILPGDYTGTAWAPAQINKYNVKIVQMPGAKVLITQTDAKTMFGTSSNITTSTCSGCEWDNRGKHSDLIIRSTFNVTTNGIFAALRRDANFTLKGGFRMEYNPAAGNGFGAGLVYVNADGTGGTINIQGPVELYKGVNNTSTAAIVYTSGTASALNVTLDLRRHGKAANGITFDGVGADNHVSICNLTIGSGDVRIALEDAKDLMPVSRADSMNLIQVSSGMVNGSARVAVDFFGVTTWGGNYTRLVSANGQDLADGSYIRNHGSIVFTGTQNGATSGVFLFGARQSARVSMQLGDIYLPANASNAYVQIGRSGYADSIETISIGTLQGYGSASGLIRRQNNSCIVDISGGLVKQYGTGATLRTLMLLNTAGKTRLRNVHFDLAAATDTAIGGDGAAATDRNFSAINVSTNGVGNDTAKTTNQGVAIAAGASY